MGSGRFFNVREASISTGGFFYPADAGEALLSQNFKADSREVEAGDVFIAVRGARVDGHDYIPGAVAAGASAVVAEREYFLEHEEDLKKLPLAFIVMPEDVKSEEGVALLAGEWLDKISPKVVGITGSVGKTTTREFLSGALSGCLRTHAAKKSYNTLIGCGMTVLSMPFDSEVLILELGTNHPGEISELVSNFPVTHAVITEISPAHLEGLKTIEGVLRAKMEICESKTLSFLSYNFDNDILRTAVCGLETNINTTGVGFGGADIAVSNIGQRLEGEASVSLEFTLSLKGDKDAMNCAASVYGRQNALNIAFAYSVAHEFGIGGEDFVAGVRSVKLPAGRGGILKGAGGCLLIDDSYNANPDSMSCALRNLVELEVPGNRKKIAILGGMKELGDESDGWHEIIMSRASLLDEVYLIGEEWESLRTQQAALRGRWPDAEAFIADFDFKRVSEAVVLVKASRYYGLDRLLPLFGAKEGGA